MPPTNHQVRLAGRPVGLPRPIDWELTSEPVPEPRPGQFTEKVSHVSIDPAMRGWMKAGASYVPPVALGAVRRAGGGRRVAAPAAPGGHRGEDGQVGCRVDGSAATRARGGGGGERVRVGGEIRGGVLGCLARGARGVLGGAGWQYNETRVRGPANYMRLLVARASMTGMLVFDYADRYPEALAELAGWL